MPFVNANTAATGNFAGGNVPLAVQGGKVRTAVAEFTLASDAAGTYTAPIQIPRGARVILCGLNSSVTLGGTATVAIGIPGAAGKYRAAATYTTADAWTFFALNAATGAELTANEQIILTVAAAALPASGRLVLLFQWVENS
jgi:hypothetical protein